MSIGAGYVDDCFVLAANYVTSYSYATVTSPPILGHAYMLQIGLRTLANTTGAASPTTGRPVEPASASEPEDDVPARLGPNSNRLIQRI